MPTAVDWMSEGTPTVKTTAHQAGQKSGGIKLHTIAENKEGLSTENLVQYGKKYAIIQQENLLTEVQKKFFQYEMAEDMLSDKDVNQNIQKFVDILEEWATKMENAQSPEEQAALNTEKQSQITTLLEFFFL